MIFWYTTAVDYIRDLLTDICLVGAAVTKMVLDGLESDGDGKPSSGNMVER